MATVKASAASAASGKTVNVQARVDGKSRIEKVTLYYTFSTDYANARWDDQPMKQEKPGLYKGAIGLGENRSLAYLVEVVDIAQELTGYTSTPPLRSPSEKAKDRATKTAGRTTVGTVAQ